MEVLAVKLKELRRKHEWSQQLVADFCMISRSALADYENGRRQPCAETLVKLADFYCVSTDYLLGRGQI